MYYYHLLRPDGFVHGADNLGMAQAQLFVADDIEVVESHELLLQRAHQHVAVVALVEKAFDEHYLVFAELHDVAEAADEFRVA